MFKGWAVAFPSGAYGARLKGLFVANALAFFNYNKKVYCIQLCFLAPYVVLFGQQCHKTFLRMNYNTFSDIYPNLMFVG
jgi:hypothetical protein